MHRKKLCCIQSVRPLQAVCPFIELEIFNLEIDSPEIFVCSNPKYKNYDTRLNDIPIVLPSDRSILILQRKKKIGTI